MSFMPDTKNTQTTYMHIEPLKNNYGAVTYDLLASTACVTILWNEFMSQTPTDCRTCIQQR